MLHSRVALRASCVKIMNMFALAALPPRGFRHASSHQPVTISISAYSVITAVFERITDGVPAGLCLTVADYRKIFSNKSRRRSTVTRRGCVIEQKDLDLKDVQHQSLQSLQEVTVL